MIKHKIVILVQNDNNKKIDRFILNIYTKLILNLIKLILLSGVYHVITLLRFYIILYIIPTSLRLNQKLM
jgi:hypothetical protein